MATEIVMPKLGLTMTHGTVTRWLKAAGDPVTSGEPLLEVSTEKINYEIEAPAAGIVLEILAREGEERECGAVVATIGAHGETPVAPANANGARHVASPAARKLARERNVPLATLTGSGPRGRITLADVHAAPARAEAAAPPASAPADVERSRRVIFERMTAAAAIPHAQVGIDLNAALLAALMDRRRDFGWTAFFVYVCARVLRDHPLLRTDARSGRPAQALGIGVAVDAPAGLVVPVIRDADRLSLAQTQAELGRLAEAARAQRLGIDDLHGGCFSISNVGPQGVDRVTPIVNAPQTAILGLGAARERAWAEAGAIVPAPVLNLTLSFDHRFIDGAPAARFLAAVAGAAIDPGLLL